MSPGNNDKAEKLYYEYLDFISSGEQSEAYLKENGFDPDELVNESIRLAKRVQMQVASEKTEMEYQDLKANLLQRVKNEVERLLSDVSFNLENFIKQEKINLAYKNFETMSREEIKEFLERHYLLKFENNSKEKSAE